MNQEDNEAAGTATASPSTAAKATVTQTKYGDFLVLMEKGDWRKKVSVSSARSYFSRSAESSGANPALFPSQVVQFRDPQNAESFLQQKTQKITSRVEEQLAGLTGEINAHLNSLYNDVAETAFSLDKYRIPYYGISEPESENPVNLFQRQLKIEDLSFELSHNKYKTTLESLVKIGKADQLAVSHRVLLNWMRVLESAVQEQ